MGVVKWIYMCCVEIHRYTIQVCWEFCVYIFYINKCLYKSNNVHDERLSNLQTNLEMQMFLGYRENTWELCENEL